MNPLIFSRQTDIFDPTDNINQKPIVVVGAGTIGSWTIFGLAKIGLKKIKVIDFDRVELQNTSNQIYLPSNVGEFKAEVMKKLLADICEIEISKTKFEETSDDFLEGQFILISAVDNMVARKNIWNWVTEVHPERVVHLIDGRMGGENLKVYSVSPAVPLEAKFYETTLHSDDSSSIQNEELRRLSDVPCTARSIVDVALMISAIIVNTVRKTITMKEVKFETIMNLSARLSL